jgi:hypothetical protein
VAVADKAQNGSLIFATRADTLERLNTCPHAPAATALVQFDVIYLEPSQRYFTAWTFTVSIAARCVHIDRLCTAMAAECIARKHQSKA